jgi:hypothetical protein
MGEEVLYKRWDSTYKCNESFILDRESDRVTIERIRDYGDGFWIRYTVTLKGGREFIVYKERHSKTDGFYNKIICKLTGERLAEVERTVGVSIEELFMKAINKIRNGEINAYTGLEELCYLHDVYMQPYTLARIREYILR